MNKQSEPVLLECDDIEKTLLAQLLVIDGGLLSLCRSERLTPDMFWRIRHQWIFDAILTLDQRGDEIDLTTVTQELERRGQLAQVNGDDMYLSKLATFNVSPSLTPALRTYAAEIRRMHEWRQLKQLGEMITTLAENRGDGMSVVTAWSKIQQQAQATRPYEPNQNFTFGADSFKVYQDMLKDAQENNESFALPWKALKPYAESVAPGDLIGVLGGSGSGKSAMLYMLAEFFAESEGKRTCYIFTEMRLKKVFDRRAAKHTGINYRRLKSNAKLVDGEKQMLQDDEHAMQSWAHKLDYWHAASIDDTTLFAQMQRMVDEWDTKVFVIDYLNDISITIQKGENAANAYRDFLADLEAFSNRTGTLIITAAQRNINDDKAYMIGQAYEQKVALLLDLKPKKLEQPLRYTFEGKTYEYSTGQYSPLVTVDVRKNRDDATGTLNLFYVGPRYLWVDVPTDFDDGSTDPGAYNESGSSWLEKTSDDRNESVSIPF
jgi:replicative DNA helicase